MQTLKPTHPPPAAGDDQMLAHIYAHHKEDAFLMDLARRLEEANSREFQMPPEEDY